MWNEEALPSEWNKNFRMPREQFVLLADEPGGGGSGAPIYGLYRYVPRNRVWFLRFSVLK